MLEIEGLHYRYPGSSRAALDGIALRAEPGRVLGLLGPNGAGKSTLVAHLAGLLPIQRGSIRIDGLPLAEARRRDPTRIAAAPQEYAFYPTLTVRENLTCFAAANRLAGAAAKQEVERCLAFGRLEDFARTRAGCLSGGLKRRLNLAIALLAQPQFIILDEPTAGVDPQSRAFLLEAVRGLARAGAAVIYTSHYMEEIEAIADEAAIVDHGRLLRHGPLAVLLAEGGAHLEIGIGGKPTAAALAALEGFGSVSAEDGRLRMELVPGAPPLAVLNALEAAGTPVREARFGRCNLETLFLRLTHTRLRDR